MMNETQSNLIKNLLMLLLAIVILIVCYSFMLPKAKKIYTRAQVDQSTTQVPGVILDRTKVSRPTSYLVFYAYDITLNRSTRRYVTEREHVDKLLYDQLLPGTPVMVQYLAATPSESRIVINTYYPWRALWSEMFIVGLIASVGLLLVYGSLFELRANIIRLRRPAEEIARETQERHRLESAGWIAITMPHMQQSFRKRLKQNPQLKCYIIQSGDVLYLSLEFIADPDQRNRHRANINRFNAGFQGSNLLWIDFMDLLKAVSSVSD